MANTNTKKSRRFLLHPKEMKKAQLVLRALSQGLRQDILLLLQEREEKGIKPCVQDIYEALTIEQSVASQHLAILRKEGVVYTTRKGKMILYSIDWNKIEKISNAVKILK